MRLGPLAVVVSQSEQLRLGDLSAQKRTAGYGLASVSFPAESLRNRFAAASSSRKCVCRTSESKADQVPVEHVMNKKDQAKNIE
jgi:hypothetical protein